MDMTKQENTILWDVATQHIAYPDAVARMEAHNLAIQQDTANELIWLVEHPPLYTGGTSADKAELLTHDFPVFDTGRGGRYTYHGPGNVSVISCWICAKEAVMCVPLCKGLNNG